MKHLAKQRWQVLHYTLQNSLFLSDLNSVDNVSSSEIQGMCAYGSAFVTKLQSVVAGQPPAIEALVHAMG